MKATIFNVQLGDLDLGYYVATTEQEARDLVSVDAGYKSEAHMLEMLDWDSIDYIVTEMITETE